MRSPRSAGGMVVLTWPPMWQAQTVPVSSKARQTGSQHSWNIGCGPSKGTNSAALQPIAARRRISPGTDAGSNTGNIGRIISRSGSRALSSMTQSL